MSRPFQAGIGITFLALFFAFLWASTTPPSGSVIEEHSSTASSSYIGTYSGSQLKQAQQFYLDESDPQPVTGIGILLRSTDRGSPTGDITLSVFNNQSGNVPGTKIAGTEKSFTPVLGVWNYISFDAGVTLGTSSGNKYWIVASTQDQSGDNDAYCWQRSNSSTYTRGYRKTFNKDGTNQWSGSQTGDFAFRVYGDASLSVLFNNAKATRIDSKVIVEWVTESEVNVQGFNVLRSEYGNGPFIKRNNLLIPANGSSSCRQSYSFTDFQVLSKREYWYKIEEKGDNGNEILCTLKVKPEEHVPGSINKIISISPNPFNPEVNITYSASEVKAVYSIYLKIYNIMGQSVRSFMCKNSGHQSIFHVVWNGKDEEGRDVPSGVYLCSMISDGVVLSTGKMFKIE